MDIIQMIRAAIVEGRLDTLQVEDITGEPNVEAPA
jgi:hypothetical protein